VRRIVYGDFRKDAKTWLGESSEALWAHSSTRFQPSGDKCVLRRSLPGSTVCLAANGLTLALELERWTLNGTIGHCLEDARERRLDLLRGSSFGLLPRRSKCSNPGTSPCLLNEPTTPDSPDFDPEHAQPILKLHLPSCPRPPARRSLPNADRARPQSASRFIPFSACCTRSVPVPSRSHSSAFAAKRLVRPAVCFTRREGLLPSDTCKVPSLPIRERSHSMVLRHTAL
jgi:hypothetical protein